MPVPWIQIVQLMPSILDVSRELLKRTRRQAALDATAPADSLPANGTLEARVRALEENERRQAELVTKMADQLAQLTVAVTALHLQARRLVIGQIATTMIAIVALVFALR